jgi:MoaA/NifB/PqqE/SkfB family radical SAM enzyme
MMQTSEVKPLDPQKYYRMPWSLSDNGIFWLEVTSQCNLTCEGCYHENIKGGHKSMAEIEEEFKVIKKLRKVDSVSIAGGDPLLHPQILDIVKLVRKYGWKPIMNTNGLALTPELLKNLKKAGVFGFTFHIDTTQKRTDSPDAKIEQDACTTCISDQHRRHYLAIL